VWYHGGGWYGVPVWCGTTAVVGMVSWCGVVPRWWSVWFLGVMWYCGGGWYGVLVWCHGGGWYGVPVCQRPSPKRWGMYLGFFKMAAVRPLDLYTESRVLVSFGQPPYGSCRVTLLSPTSQSKNLVRRGGNLSSIFNRDRPRGGARGYIQRSNFQKKVQKSGQIR